MKNCDLMYGCLGNGVTVADRSRTVRGDYKTVAHIEPCGLVKIIDKRIGAEDAEKIRRMARRVACDYAERFAALPAEMQRAELLRTWEKLPMTADEPFPRGFDEMDTADRLTLMLRYQIAANKRRGYVAPFDD